MFWGLYLQFIVLTYTIACSTVSIDLTGGYKNVIVAIDPKIPESKIKSYLDELKPIGYGRRLVVGVLSIIWWVRVLLSLKTNLVEGLMHIKFVEAQSTQVIVKSTQVSSSSLDHGSKLRGSSSIAYVTLPRVTLIVNPTCPGFVLDLQF
ncbi:hypothetical protein TNCV_436351 [Trichonephila clavipes]|nr:hypothetical protein TNCV_436351 [Trichonephila clavipes]